MCGGGRVQLEWWRKHTRLQNHFVEIVGGHFGGYTGWHSLITNNYCHFTPRLLMSVPIQYPHWDVVHDKNHSRFQLFCLLLFYSDTVYIAKCKNSLHATIPKPTVWCRCIGPDVTGQCSRSWGRGANLCCHFVLSLQRTILLVGNRDAYGLAPPLLHYEISLLEMYKVMSICFVIYRENWWTFLGASWNLAFIIFWWIGGVTRLFSLRQLDRREGVGGDTLYNWRFNLTARPLIILLYRNLFCGVIKYSFCCNRICITCQKDNDR